MAEAIPVLLNAAKAVSGGYSEIEVMRERHFDRDRFRCNDCGAGVRSVERICRKESLLDKESGQFPRS
jgi:hypothetical protein